MESGRRRRTNCEVTINVTGDWHVRSEQEKQEIISELGERVREELRGL